MTKIDTIADSIFLADMESSMSRLDCSTARRAHGRCYEVTLWAWQNRTLDDVIPLRLVLDVSMQERLHIARTRNQHTDHYALCHNGIVCDYTMRQFHEDAPYPLVCSIEEWVSMMEEAWGGTAIRVDPATLCAGCITEEADCVCEG